MVSAVRRGLSQRKASVRFSVPLSTVQYWVRRTAGKRLNRVDWEDRPFTPKTTQRTPEDMEALTLKTRRELKKISDLGEYGADAIEAELIRQSVSNAPSVRTIGRILKRCGALDGRERVRRPPPPRGWYLPHVSEGLAELDSFDIVEGLVIRGGTDVEVLNGISLHGGLPVSWAMDLVTAKQTVDCLQEHWQQFGLPQLVQFDNDTIFQGAHQHKDSFGRVTRLCLALGITPVFTPPREPGFQASIENYNGRWQQKVWSRFEHQGLADLRDHSDRYVAAYRKRQASSIENAPERLPFPVDWQLDLQQPLRGQVVYIRRTNEKGEANFLGRTFAVSSNWPHRLVRCEVELEHGRIRFYALRRKTPDQHRFLAEVPYSVPTKKFDV